MSYGDNEFKRKGIALEADTCEMIVAELQAKGYKVYAKKSSLDEDRIDKIDYYLIFDDSTPFHGMTKFPIDIKVGDTYTVINSIGENTLQCSKSTFIIFRFNNKLHWALERHLKEWVEKNPQMLRESYNLDGSKYIKVKSFPYFNIF